MSKVIISELISTLSQEFSIEQRIFVPSVSIKVVIINDPTGTFTLEILEGNKSLASSSLTMSEIVTNANWTPGENHFGFLNFDFNKTVVLNPGLYKLKLSSSGYSFGFDSFFSWVREHVFEINNFEPFKGNDTGKPLSHILWSYEA